MSSPDEQRWMNEQRAASREYQKKHRAKTLVKYSNDKKLIDSFSDDELFQFVASATADQAHDVRPGIHSMKVNSYEYALIKAAAKKRGCKSSRDLLISFCKEVLSDD